MKLKKIQSSKDNLRMSFSAEDCSEAFLNGIRRLIIEEVPTLAIEDVEFKDNNSALYDEMLALRRVWALKLNLMRNLILHHISWTQL